MLKSPKLVRLADTYLRQQQQQQQQQREGARLTERPEIIMAATSCKSYVGTSPPSSRLPPDGHEFPGDYMDDTSHSNSKLTGRGRSGSGGNVWRTSHNGRDERSERSVKDKIALFTNEPAPQSTTGRTQAVSSKTKYPTLSCSVDNLSVGRSPMVSPVIRHSDVRTLPRHQLAVPAVSNNKSSTISSVDRDTTPVNLSERSRSLLDVAHYSPPPSNGNGQRHSSELQSPSDKQQRKLSLVNLAADSRRKLSLSNSKLRGLVIPDVVDGATSGCEPSRAVIDLPEIISKDSVMVVGLAPLAPLRSPNGHHVFGNNSDQDVTDSVQQQQQQKTTPLSSLPWKSNSPSLPKYSPAFKRKELTVLRTPYGSESVPNPPGQQSSSKPALLTSFSCPSDVEVSSPVAEENAANNSDTDGDSAVSSSRSSFSPSGSPLPDRNASEETTALATAASRVLKAQSVEALNRKNVLQSARYSSGGGVGGPHLELAPPSSPPAVPPPAVPTTITTDVKLTVDINPQQVVIPSLASPALRSGQRNNSKLSGDFEQTLRKFSSAEASSRIERSSPRLRLSSSERLEMKTALITDVCSDPASPPGTKTTNPFPRDSSPSTKKIPAVAHHSASKEIKSFRALAERWEAIASEAPASSGSSPPSNNIVTSKKPEVISQPDERDGLSQPIKTTTTTTSPAIRPASTARAVTSRSVSAGVVEIRKAFERVKEELETESNCHYGREGAGGSLEDYKQHHSLFSLQQSVNNSAGHHYHQHVRMSSLDSTTSEDSSLPFGFGFGYGGVGYGSYYGGPFGIGVRDNYGSITSLASSTSLISPQELQQLLDEANQSLEESGTPSHEIVVVVLHRGDVASSLSPGLGITLAGGADYETKEITIHKVIGGSVADRDGRIQKGDRVLSINGKGLKGVTHREALAILKAPRPEVVLVLSRNRSVSPQDCHEVDKDLPPVMIPASNTGLLGNPRNSHLLLSGSGSGISRPPRILESPNDFTDYDQANEEDLSRDPPLQTTLVKDGAGLGFSLEGGKDSPLGDRPLTIKKIFTGGAASKNSTLRVGDQIISVNGCDVTSMSRIEAWNLMKKLPDGAVSLIIRQQITSS